MEGRVRDRTCFGLANGHKVPSFESMLHFCISQYLDVKKTFNATSYKNETRVVRTNIYTRKRKHIYTSTDLQTLPRSRNITIMAVGNAP